MATITSKTNPGSVALTDEFAINRGGNDFKISFQELVDYLTNATAFGVSIALNNTFRTTTVAATYLPLAGGTVTGQISGITPTSAANLTRKDYVDGLIANQLALAGGTLTGFATLHADPTSALHAATKQYVDAVSNAAVKVPTNIDCSANPNYPAASAGDLLRVSVAGKIGGASGPDVVAGHIAFCLADTASGDEATVGSNWAIVDIRRIVATTTEDGVVRKATTAQAQELTASDVYIDAVELGKTINAFNKVTSSASATLTLAASNIPMQMVVFYSRSATGTGTVTLPVAGDLDNANRVRIIVKDTGGDASTNNITVQGQGGATVDGSASLTMSTDYEAKEFVTDGTDWFTV